MARNPTGTIARPDGDDGGRGPRGPVPAGVRVLSGADTPALRRLVARDPVANVFMDAQLEATGTAAPSASGARILGLFEDGRLASACWVGANIVPVGGDARSGRLFGEAILPLDRRFSSVFGPAGPVLGLWDALREGPQRAFDIRPNQPLMVLDRAPSLAPDPAVRPAERGDFDALLPACARMFEEELGYSPLAGGGSHYRVRVRSLIRQGHSLVDRDAGGGIRFKAELGTVSRRASQIQGVWMAPEHRGRGLAAGRMAAVAAYALRIAPVTSLYVNDYNGPALATYRRVGFREAGTFATVLF